MDGLKAILERRSCRVYQDRPVDENVIENLLRAGMYAPSAMNSQPWEFIVVKDTETKEALSRIAPYWNPLKKAPLGILVMADLTGYRSSNREFFVQDCAASTTCILLAAHAQGLGGVYLGLYPEKNRMAKVRKLLGIPEHVIPFAITAIGYPDKPSHPHSTFHTSKVHREKY